MIPPATAQLTTNTPQITLRYQVYLSAFGDEVDLYLIKNARVAESADKVKNKLASANGYAIFALINTSQSTKG